MKDGLKIVAGVLALVVFLLVVTWAIQGSDFFIYKVFAPKYEQTRRDVFEESRAFNQGLNQEIQNMRFDYEQADDEHRAALRSIILHRAAGYEDHLSEELQAWVVTLKGEHINAEES